MTCVCAGFAYPLYRHDLRIEKLEQQSCASSSGCKVLGQCTAKDGNCVAGSDADCADLCEVSGECTARYGECVAISDVYCAKSMGCKKWGNCTAKDGECVIGKTEGV